MSNSWSNKLPKEPGIYWARWPGRGVSGLRRLTGTFYYGLLQVELGEFGEQIVKPLSFEGSQEDIQYLKTPTAQAPPEKFQETIEKVHGIRKRRGR